MTMRPSVQVDVFLNPPNFNIGMDHGNVSTQVIAKDGKSPVAAEGRERRVWSIASGSLSFARVPLYILGVKKGLVTPVRGTLTFPVS